MKSGCCLLLYLAVVALVCPSKPVIGQSLSVGVELQYTPLVASDCIGGGEDGLTNTSVLLQYRVVMTDGATLEWNDVAAIPSMGETMVTRLLTLNGPVEGVQFRLLQLEHGGGGCNCWTLDSMAVTLDSAGTLSLAGESDTCFTSSTGMGFGSFCDDGAGEARGFITRVFYFPGNDGIRCGSDNNMLISDQGPSLPPNCAMEIPRL